MKMFLQNSLLFRLGLAMMLGALMGGTTHADLILAFGQRNATNEVITIRDHHIDHYHTFTSNISEPFELVPGGGYVTVSYYLANIAPDASLSHMFPDVSGSLFRLQTVSVPSGMQIEFVHDDHTHAMSTGSAETLSLTEANEVRFFLLDGTAPGDIIASLRIFDANGVYPDTGMVGGNPVSSAHSIVARAVPEPTSLALVGLAASSLAMRSRRRADKSGKSVETSIDGWS